jgi:hypothetical protein
MAIKFSKKSSVLRNELIFSIDAKAVNLDNTLINLYMLLQWNGQRPLQKAKRGSSVEIDLDRFTSVFKGLEEAGEVVGFSEHPKASLLWLRANLLNMVNRGQVDNEMISSLRPIHIESYRVRNARRARDYYSADQVYTMLSVDPQVKNSLRDFLKEGWDTTTNSVTSVALDVDSLGILKLAQRIAPGFFKSQTTTTNVQPLLPGDAKLYCDDVRRLLVYKRSIPRSVMINYFKVITAFHLSRYLQKVIQVLPKMVAEGTTQVSEDWNIVVDCTDDFESKISASSIEDATKLNNSVYAYLEASFKVNIALTFLKVDRTNSDDLDRALKLLKKPTIKFKTYAQLLWEELTDNLAEADRELVDEVVQYEETDFDKYLALLMNQKSKRQYNEYRRLLSNLSFNNSDNGFMAQGRSKKHPRRFVMGTRLLETLVQLLVLDVKEDAFYTRNLSIEELIEQLRERYGLIINGLEEPRFSGAVLHTHLAFKENVDAFKHKLRQIGFYNDLSDAYILQKIRPRYDL